MQNTGEISMSFHAASVLQRLRSGRFAACQYTFASLPGVASPLYDPASFSHHSRQNRLGDRPPYMALAWPLRKAILPRHRCVLQSAPQELSRAGLALLVTLASCRMISTHRAYGTLTHSVGTTTDERVAFEYRLYRSCMGLRSPAVIDISCL